MRRPYSMFARALAAAARSPAEEPSAQLGFDDFTTD